MVTVGDMGFLQYVRQFTANRPNCEYLECLQQTAAAASIFDFLASEEEKDVSTRWDKELCRNTRSIKARLSSATFFGYHSAYNQGFSAMIR